MKMTLLEMTQEILSSMDSDEINSINDTVESYQVALLIRGVYYDMAVEFNLPEHVTTFNLDASGDSSLPVQMTVPETVSRVDWIQYDSRDDGDDFPDYKDIQFMPFQDFLRLSNSLRETTDDVDSMSVEGDNASTFTLLFETNKHPQFYTHINDHTILFDSFDSDVDTTLESSKALAHGVIYPVFTLEDSFTPDIDATQFPLLRNKAKFRAFNELKQITNQEAGMEVKIQKTAVQKKKRTIYDEPEVFKVMARYGKTSASRSGRIPRSLRSGS